MKIKSGEYECNKKSKIVYKKSVWLLVLFIYLICELVKDFEFLVLKTDRTFLAENIVCKLFMIGVIFFCLKKLPLLSDGIGFGKAGLLRGAALGFALGIVTFFFSYLAELLILQGMGLHPALSFYISNFSLESQNITGVSIPALLICLAGNALNVWAEEGIFRGVLYRTGTAAFGGKGANLLQAFLFGFWHVILPVAWLIDGSLTLPAAIVMAAGYIVLAGILGYEWGLCAAMTGSLWTGIFEHFFNNFIGNSLHVVTETGADELQILRIVLSNVLSLTIVLILSRRTARIKNRA